jgi:hypothetical protein
MGLFYPLRMRTITGNQATFIAKAMKSVLKNGTSWVAYRRERWDFLT